MWGSRFALFERNFQVDDETDQKTDGGAEVPSWFAVEVIEVDGGRRFSLLHDAAGLLAEAFRPGPAFVECRVIAVVPAELARLAFDGARAAAVDGVPPAWYSGGFAPGGAVAPGLNVVAGPDELTPAARVQAAAIWAAEAWVAFLRPRGVSPVEALQELRAFAEARGDEPPASLNSVKGRTDWARFLLEYRPASGD